MNNTAKRQQTNYNEIVGISESGEIYMLDYVFDHGDGFRGAVGSVFCPVTQGYIDYRNDFDHIKEEYDYLWRDSVAAGNCEDSLDDFIQSLIDSSDGEFFGHDTSNIQHISDSFREEHFPDAVTFECIGGGRCFSPRTTKWAKLLRPDLLEIIKDYEID